MCKKHFSPIHCIIPPYMLKKLMESGNKKVADLAMNTDFRSYRFRNDRIYFQNASLREKTLFGMITKQTGKVTMQMEVYDCKQKTDLAGATLLWDTKNNQKITSLAGKNVIKGGKAVFVQVKTGVRESANIEVSEGISAGDTIVTTGILFLKPGMNVKLSKINN